MIRHLQTASTRINQAVDWFIPETLKKDPDIIQGVRMFLFSHMFGPFLGHTISLYILFVQGEPDLAWFIFFGAITAFWPFTFALRKLGLYYVPLALVSIQNLIFIILWGCYHYGGINSPILPWLITVPLLAFFYLPTRKTRIIVSVLIVTNLVVFYFIYNSLGFPETIPLAELSYLGFVSTFCAGMYVSMMALYYANIVSSQSELEQEVHRHLETARKLQAATEEARHAIRAKSEFLANMSHELRTPLNAIIGYSEMLIEDVAEGQQCDDLQAINSAGQKLLQLINDLLDLSKLEAGKMDLYPERFPLWRLVEEVVAHSQPLVLSKGLEFRVDSDDDAGEVVSDAGRLRQVVVSLIDNAAKFTKSGHVAFSAAVKNGEIVIAVSDTGIGIKPDQMANLFETFGKQESETASNYREDPGLGLPLSHRLCSLMEGTLTVESEAGRGCCFTVRVPAQLTKQKIVSPGVGFGADPRQTVPSLSSLTAEGNLAAMGGVEHHLDRKGTSLGTSDLRAVA